MFIFLPSEFHSSLYSAQQILGEAAGIIYVLLVGTVFYYPIINVIRSWSPVSRQPPISSSVINSSLSIITRSKIALPRVRCHPFCVRKWSPIILRDATHVLFLPAGGLQRSPPSVTSCRKGQVSFRYPAHPAWAAMLCANMQPAFTHKALHHAHITAYQCSKNCHILLFMDSYHNQFFFYNFLSCFCMLTTPSISCEEDLPALPKTLQHTQLLTVHAHGHEWKSWQIVSPSE